MKLQLGLALAAALSVYGCGSKSSSSDNSKGGADANPAGKANGSCTFSKEAMIKNISADAAGAICYEYSGNKTVDSDKCRAREGVPVNGPCARENLVCISRPDVESAVFFYQGWPKSVCDRSSILNSTRSQISAQDAKHVDLGRPN